MGSHKHSDLAKSPASALPAFCTSPLVADPHVKPTYKTKALRTDSPPVQQERLVCL